jgi:hypothetical protein
MRIRNKEDKEEERETNSRYSSGDLRVVPG